MNKQEVLRRELKGKIFTVTFVKKSGEVRKLNCRLGVTKHLKGGNKSFRDADFNYLTVFDLQKKAYRTVNLNTVQKIICKKDLTHLVK